MIQGLPEGGVQDDAPPAGDRCNTTADCLEVPGMMVDCHVECRLSGGVGRCFRSASINTPDGVACGPTTDDNDICVDGTCEMRRCGDGFTDTGAGEYCDDANTNEEDFCRSCQIPCTDGAPPTTCVNMPPADPCMGGAGTCDSASSPGFCIPNMPLPDGMECMTPGGETGECERGVCLVQLP